LNAQALISMGRLMRRRDDDAAALGFYLRALREAPEREDIHREVMSIYYNMGKYDDARIQYEIVQKLLHESLKIEPARETRELYDLIKARL
jgi:DNA-binding SARP family transcriptional activator